MTFAALPAFDLAAFLASAGPGRRIVALKPKQSFFSQGDPADSVFYLQKGRARITVVSAAGKEATVTLLVPSEFVGEDPPSRTPPCGRRFCCAEPVQVRFADQTGARDNEQRIVNA